MENDAANHRLDTGRDSRSPAPCSTSSVLQCECFSYYAVLLLLSLLNQLRGGCELLAAFALCSLPMSATPGGLMLEEDDMLYCDQWKGLVLAKQPNWAGRNFCSPKPDPGLGSRRSDWPGHTSRHPRGHANHTRDPPWNS